MKNLVYLTVEVLERGTSRHARIIAPGIARALEIAGGGKPEAREAVLPPCAMSGMPRRSAQYPKRRSHGQS